MPVDLPGLPLEIVWSNTEPITEDWSPIPGNLAIVSKRFAEMLEALEPDRHQLIPVRLTFRELGPTHDSTMYVVNMPKLADHLDPEKSAIREYRMAHTSIMTRRLAYGGGAGVVLRPEVVASHHLWQSIQREDYGTFYGSSELVSRAQSMGCRSMSSYKCYPAPYPPQG